ncbi:MAG: DUF4386 family protein [Bacillati bacterium ANGP1]|uniref:DUF4386 family protein n=1 Tax=Candidatus Segetimicrobium genomatis TaxID=2569760 RepID=A0A537IYH3_9BACT|nr:MAG: DUF4386 family protein [Terrabacteria group bacterium ANGP1]
MNPRPQTAGTAGIIAGVLLAVLLILFMSSGMRPEAMADPGKMMAYVGQNASRWRSMSFLGILTTIAAVFYFPGLAARLRDRTPSRATGVLYFGILGIGGHGLGAALQWAGDPLVAGAGDQVAAGHAWLALNAVHAGLETFGSLGTGLVLLLAGWAAMNSKAFSPGVAWVGLVGGIVTLVSVLRPPGPLFLLSFALSIVFLIWSGLELRKAK